MLLDVSFSCTAPRDIQAGVSRANAGTAARHQCELHGQSTTLWGEVPSGDRAASLPFSNHIEAVLIRGVSLPEGTSVTLASDVALSAVGVTAERNDKGLLRGMAASTTRDYRCDSPCRLVIRGMKRSVRWTVENISAYQRVAPAWPANSASSGAAVWRMVYGGRLRTLLNQSSLAAVLGRRGRPIRPRQRRISGVRVNLFHHLIHKSSLGFVFDLNEGLEAVIIYLYLVAIAPPTVQHLVTSSSTPRGSVSHIYVPD